MGWGLPSEVERRKRIRLAVAAYAYETQSDSIMSDAEFDALAQSIDPDVSTFDWELDDFFATEFAPHTGVWVHKHPGLAGLARVYDEIWRNRDARNADRT
jgi:hypothetical protein